MKETGHFENYDYSNNQKTDRHDYDLSRVTVPVAIYYTPEDVLSHVDDIETLAKQLPNVYKKESQSDYNNNLDFLYAENVYKFYQHVFDTLQENQRQKSRSMLV